MRDGAAARRAWRVRSQSENMGAYVKMEKVRGVEGDSSTVCRVERSRVQIT